MEFWLPLELFRESQAPCRAVCRPCGFFRMMHGGVSAPSCCAFTHRVAFEEVSGHRVLIKSGPENRGRSARGTSHMASLEFPPETGLILRCTRKAGNPFQRKQGNRLSCRDQEGRRGSDEVVPGPSVFPSRHPACRRTFAVSSRVSSTVSHLRTEHGTSLETPGISVFPWSETGMLGNFGVASRVPSSISSFKMERGTSLETLAGKGLILR